MQTPGLLLCIKYYTDACQISTFNVSTRDFNQFKLVLQTVSARVRVIQFVKPCQEVKLIQGHCGFVIDPHLNKDFIILFSGHDIKADIALTCFQFSTFSFYSETIEFSFFLTTGNHSSRLQHLQAKNYSPIWLQPWEVLDIQLFLR